MVSQILILRQWRLLYVLYMYVYNWLMAGLTVFSAFLILTGHPSAKRRRGRDKQSKPRPGMKGMEQVAAGSTRLIQQGNTEDIGYCDYLGTIHKV